MLAANKVLRGRYRIIRQLGQGEAGSVYKAFDSARETNVALKEIIIDLDKVPGATEREILKREFANQAKNLAKVKHESLPQLRGYFSEIDRHYLVMELVEGDDAGELLAKNKNSLSLADAVNWADQLLDTLDYLHTLAPPIIHGDVKPQNVLLTSRGKIKLLGFDIVAEDSDTKANVLAGKQTSVASTLRYLSLEQVLRTIDLSSQKPITEKYGEKIKDILSQPVDARSDLYALGATLYHLVTGKLPLAAMERALSIWAEKSDPLAAPHTVNPSVPIEVSDVLMKAMEIDCKNRFHTATEMRQTIQKAVLQAKEREVEEAKKKEQEASLELRQAEEKRLEEQRKLIEQERLQLEAAQKQQRELIAEQLRVAEAERLKAEQRAAEAEKLLLSQKEAKKISDKKSSNAAAESAKNTAPVSDAPKTNNQTIAPEVSRDLFAAEPTPAGKPSWIIPVIVVMFLVVGGVAGFMFMRSSNAVESKQLNTTQTNVLADKTTPEPKIETPPQPTAEKISETGVIPETSQAPNSDKTPAVQSSFKNKTAVAVPVPTPRSAKPVAPTTKTPANQKKAVTVDDLINGN